VGDALISSWWTLRASWLATSGSMSPRSRSPCELWASTCSSSTPSRRATRRCSGKAL
jgi:hypothetical protein